MGVMTPSSLGHEKCHDTTACHDTPGPGTVTPVTKRVGKGTARQTVRIDEELWTKLGLTTETAGTDRSTVLREFVRWYVREEGAELPERPGEDPTA